MRQRSAAGLKPPTSRLATSIWKALHGLHHMRHPEHRSI
uniref:Uncharacterized protein n=1 Tax=Anguilla anguilla TaxID=7936 RepID=A0A0E9QSR2_ANGAN